MANKIGYDKNIDYQAKINEAIAKGDTQTAMQYETQRNAKLTDMNNTGTNTNNYEKTYTYKDNDGSGLYDLADTWIDPNAPIRPMRKEQTQQSGGFDSQYSSQINDLIGALQSYQNADSMGRDESQARAYSQLNNMYNANLDKTLNNYNKDAISRGMFGQLPTEALKQNAISESELNKSSAINELSNSLYTQDFNMARQKDQDFYNKQNNLLNVLTQGYNIDKDIYQTQQNEQNAEKQEWINNIGQYSNDYMAEINNLMNDGDSSNDWRTGYLQNARNQKIAGIGQTESKQQEQLYKQAMDMFDTLGYADGWIANTLGVPEGTTTWQYQNMVADNARMSKVNSGSSIENNQLPKLDSAQLRLLRSDIEESISNRKATYSDEGIVIPYAPTTNEVLQELAVTLKALGYDDTAISEYLFNLDLLNSADEISRQEEIRRNLAYGR